MKLLNGSELAGYIKERQVHQARALRQAWGVRPKLAILRTTDDPVADSYMRRKQAYGADISVEVEIHSTTQQEVISQISALNADSSVHGIIVQIPLPDPAQTDEILNVVMAEKDVDGLAADTLFDPATPTAINWLLAGYNIGLMGKRIVIVGQGRLVGKPLARMWQASGLDIQTADKQTADLKAMVEAADILVCAAGVPQLITPDMIKPEVVIVDAGVARDKSGLVGDVASEVRDLPTVTITPEKGGVGPLTVCALFDNVLRAARATAEVSAG